METLTHTDLYNKVKDQKGCTIIAVEAETHKNIPLNKTNKGKGKDARKLVTETGIDKDNVTKHSISRYLFGKLTYEDLVNNRLLSEAQAKGKEKAQLSFTAETRSWGERISHTVVGHKGNYYLTAYPLNRNKNIKPVVEYRHNGKAFDITDPKFDEFRSAPKKEGENQGTETPVLYRDFGFESILTITINGEQYKVVPDPQD